MVAHSSVLPAILNTGLIPEDIRSSGPGVCFPVRYTTVLIFGKPKHDVPRVRNCSGNLLDKVLYTRLRTVDAGNSNRFLSWT